MEIRDLTAEHHDVFCVCLDDRSEDMAESGPHKAEWLRRIIAKAVKRL